MQISTRTRIRPRALKRVLSLVACCLLAVTMVPSTARASDGKQGQSDPERASAIEYSVGSPEVVWVKAPDGADIYVELYRPVAGADGIAPPDQYPVVLRMTPYEGSASARFYESLNSAAPAVQGPPLSWTVRNRYVKKGYAFALAHSYGSGNSEGCLEMFGPNEVAATSAVIEYLGTAPWSNGRVGMFGTSYDGGVALHAAARSSEAALDHLAAVVAWDGTTSLYETFGHDGVPGLGAATSLTASYAAIGQAPAPLSPVSTAGSDAEGLLARQASSCRVENMAAAEDFETTGNFSPWLADRSARSSAENVRAATLMYEGFHDGNGVGALAAVGFFDQIPKHTPHKLVLGQWGHAQNSQYRADVFASMDLWFDRFLLDLPTGAEDWPNVQIQDSAGRWRAEDQWPSTSGPVGQLVLSAEGTLGATTPTGSTSYPEVSFGGGTFSTGNIATFTTGALAGALHLAGHPVLDLWVTPQSNDGHIAVQLHAYASDGTPITGTGPIDNLTTSGRFWVVGYRSLQHLDPIVDGEFSQATPGTVAAGVPMHVPVRFMFPLDVVVPAGGRIVVEIAGANFQGLVPSTPSGSIGDVEILHDCDYPSALRFVMPDAEPEWLDVPMRTKPQAELFPVDVPEGLRDGGGLASEKVCHRQPIDPEKVLDSTGGR